MAKLRREVQVFIVRSLAQFNTPTETAQAVQQEFGIEMTRQKCEAYDPTKRTGQNLSAELKSEFEATRKQFVESPQNIPVANLTYRLERMQRIVDHAGKNSMLVLTTLEQAAKDVGGMYEAKRNDNDLQGVAQPVQVIVDVVDARVKPDDSAKD
jgi:hypothetical protein